MDPAPSSHLVPTTEPDGRASRAARAAALAKPALVAALTRFVRGRIPLSEADDVVQSTLADALAAERAPADPAELQRWLYGVARHKIADFFRRSRREVLDVDGDGEGASAAAAAPPSADPASARDLLRWAERELPEGEGSKATLDWMLREGCGEKLETIAAEERVPAPRVRQRVARLRRHLRARWAAQLAAAALLTAVVVAFAIAWSRGEREVVRPDVPPQPSFAPLPPRAPTPEERAAAMRDEAFDACDARDWTRCLERLDAARDLDPAGDTARRVQDAREQASDALAPPKPKPAPRPIGSGASLGSFTPPASTSTAPPTAPAKPFRGSSDFGTPSR